jgi:hypothetical protein
MAQAHKMTREAMSKVDKSVCVITYKQAFSVYLRAAHIAYKEECKNSPIDWYSVEGHVVCEETGTYIPFYEGTSKASVAAANVLWYVENFDKHFVKVVASRENGSVVVEKAKTNYK